MACNCKHNESDIRDKVYAIKELRKLFIKRMTVNSESQDRRKRDYNQAIFSWWDVDEDEADPHKAFQVWSDMTMDMVLRCFDDAANDYIKSFCDVKNCTRHRKYFPPKVKNKERETK